MAVIPMHPSSGLAAPQRLAALEETGLLEALSDDVTAGLAHWAELAARRTGASRCLVSAFDEHHQLVLAAGGPGAPPSPVAPTAAEETICIHALLSGGPLAVDDAQADPRTSRLDAVQHDGVGAYLGVAIRSVEGRPVGTVCLIEDEARAWTQDDVVALEDCTRGVEAEVALLAERRRRAVTDHLLACHDRVHRQLAEGRELGAVLTTIVLGLEEQLEGLLASVMLLDEDGLTLSNGAAPSLPEAYQRAVDGLVVGPRAGSCGTAVHTASEVTVRDIMRDDRWTAFRAAASHAGLRACWSVPVFGRRGTVLGSFALYAREPMEPTATMQHAARRAAALASIAIERWNAERELEHLAGHDLLTRLANRRLLVQRLSRALERRRQERCSVAVLFADLDGFGLINDVLGHDAGDQVLVQVARRLEAACGPLDTVARFGGDEFVVVAEGLDEAGADALAERVLAALTDPVPLEGAEHGLAGSVGIALAGPDAAADELVSRAARAMERARRDGQGVGLYDDALHATSAERLELLGALRGARERGELRVAYQPIMRLGTGEAIAVEALVRWEHPELGPISPGRFIPLAEEHGLIDALGAFVLDRALEDMAALRAAATRPLTMSVNLSTRQLQRPGFAERLQAMLARHDVAPEYLMLELTETAVMPSDAGTLERLRAISELGVSIVLDDFGTGYSSLSHLRSLPIRGVKIDRAFVAGMGHDADDEVLVAGMIGLCRGLRLAVIAEGLEEESQVAALAALGCVYGQGYHLSRPKPLAEVVELLRAATHAPVAPRPPRASAAPVAL